MPADLPSVSTAGARRYTAPPARRLGSSLNSGESGLDLEDKLLDAVKTMSHAHDGLISLGEKASAHSTRPETG